MSFHLTFIYDVVGEEHQQRLKRVETEDFNPFLLKSLLELVCK